MKIKQPLFPALRIAAILLAGLVWIVLSAAPADAPAERLPAPRAGFPAPPFSLPALSGGTLALADLRGQVVVLNLWASWCPPCRAEMPALQRAYADYRERGVIVLAVNATDQDSLEDAAAFVRQNGLTFPVLLDERGEVSRLYLLRSLPTTFFIGRDGLIREVVVGGPMSEALLRTRIETLLEETP